MTDSPIDNTIARVYTNACLERLPEYYEYEKLQVIWG